MLHILVDKAVTVNNMMSSVMFLLMALKYIHLPEKRLLYKILVRLDENLELELLSVDQDNLRHIYKSAKHTDHFLKPTHN